MFVCFFAYAGLLLTFTTQMMSQEKQIRGKQAMKQFSDKMRDQRAQVTDRVRKHVAAARIPKVVSAPDLECQCVLLFVTCFPPLPSSHT